MQHEESARGIQDRSHQAAANEIKARHDHMIRHRETAVNDMHQVCLEAIEIAGLVETVHSELGGRRFVEWWRSCDLPVGWADRYLRLARTAERAQLHDKDQLRLIGILPEAVGTTAGQQHRDPNPFAWIRWTQKIIKTIPVESVESMDAADRSAALKHLQPIKELIAKLEAPHKKSP